MTFRVHPLRCGHVLNHPEAGFLYRQAKRQDGGARIDAPCLAMNMALLTLAGGMLYGSQPVLWSIPGDLLPRGVAAATTGIINGIGVLGAFTGPYVVGYARGVSGSFAAGLAVMGVCLILSAILVFLIAEIAPLRLKTGTLPATLA